MFGEIAPRYDLLNHLLSFNVDRRWRRKTVQLTAPRGPVLDVCTGTGDLAAEYRREGEQAVTGVDFCAPMLRRGKSKSRCAGVRFVRGMRSPSPSPATASMSSRSPSGSAT